MENTETAPSPVAEGLTPQAQAPATPAPAAEPEPKPLEGLNADAKKVAKSFREALADNFYKKKQEEGAVKPAEAKTPEQVDAQALVAEMKPEDIVVPPSSLKAEERQYFDKLPTELKKYVARREQEITMMGHQRAQRVAELEKELAPVVEHYKRYESDYIKQGINPTDVVRRAIEWDQAFKSNPKQAAFEYLQAYGIEPADLVLDDTIETGQEQQPTLTADQIREQVRQELLAEEQKKQAEYLLRENSRIADEFVVSTPFGKDPSSRQELEEAMGQVVARLVNLEPNRDKREILQEAYDHITKKDPRFSTIRSQYEQAGAAAKAREEAAKAAFAGRSINGAAGGAASATPPRTFRENLKWRMSNGA